jgi:hypothetical protein
MCPQRATLAIRSPNPQASLKTAAQQHYGGTLTTHLCETTQRFQTISFFHLQLSETFFHGLQILQV